MHERRFHGDLDRLRSPARLILLEVDRVVELSLEGITASTVLDVGTGTGVFAEAFAGSGLDVAGIDTNPDMIAAAQRHVPQGHFQQAPAEEIPFPDASFDLVFLGHVLHETDDPLKALAEARRVATQRVVALEWPYREEEHGPPLAHRLEPQTIARLVREAGFPTLDRISLQRSRVRSASLGRG